MAVTLYPVGSEDFEGIVICADKIRAWIPRVGARIGDDSDCSDILQICSFAFP